MDKVIDVSCAIIVDEQGLVLVSQRSLNMKLPLKWEFPGGKVELGETASECLIREIKEELSLDIRILSEMPANSYSYPDFSIRLIPFICEITRGTIVLKEHAAFEWLSRTALMDLDWAEADVRVVKDYLDLTNWI